MAQTPKMETTVVVVGGGPVGLLTSLQLAHHGTKNILLERNLETTKWPKMDLTNGRSMELLRRMGLAADLRKHGVPGNFSFDVICSTGLDEGGELIHRWEIPCPDEVRKSIQEKNDGTWPREAGQRISQVILEPWLRSLCDANPLIQTHYGHKVESVKEESDSVTTCVTDVKTGEAYNVKSQYVVGCDGAGSRVRRSVGIKLTGGPGPMGMLLVHFKSRDTTRLHVQGQWWHIFFTNGAISISQDEVDTWTFHIPISLDTDVSQIDPVEAVRNAIGGAPLEIDEVLVSSTWRGTLAVADKYRSAKGRVFLAGDSVHQNIPTGGYGMNTGLGDAFDIGWKLAAFLQGWCGEAILDSYELERRPVALRNVERSGVHMKVHLTVVEMIKQSNIDPRTNTKEAEELKLRISEHYKLNDGENRDRGIEMDYRFPDSPVVIPSPSDVPRRWSPREYVPSTVPGSRAPHVFLQDGRTSIFDLYGPEYTIVNFTPNKSATEEFQRLAIEAGIPLTEVHVPNEKHARKLWERDLVMVRPDGFVCWRSDRDASPPKSDEIASILRTVTGKGWTDATKTSTLQQREKFTSTIGNVDMNQADAIQMLGEFQK
ncbi:uncharacterized protein Z520_00896 [Fonsecaea multimorphosa CBS 102226]|uniref:FAD-binding domain-containing protein n=1 Tax=Fonsecaea multimorphosa CBS 102226 TaxID=1442371 RepID=A0A0D2KDL3_9EURO|nr:uncharacterized protein Z520_00896 [Fonsecaea multimorphosa CBS 102226]KIY04203.1 hypothetical protein Z520_00896 [Fonsecaea multimorphosa CBS 102226]